MDSVVLTIIGALVVLVVAILNWATSSGETDKLKRAYQYAVLLAAAFTAFGTWRGFLLNEEKTWQQAEVQFQNDWLQRKQLKERLQYERELRAQTIELAKKSDELTKKSAEIASLNRTIAGSVTGGDSFAVVSIQDSFPFFNVGNEGKFPLYGITARIVDLDKFRLLVKEGKVGKQLTNEQQLALYGTTVFIGDLAVGAGIFKNIRYSFAEFERRDFNVFFSARNGFWTQLIRWRRVQNRWILATKVMHEIGKSQKTVYQKIDKEFPTNLKGEVDWNFAVKDSEGSRN